MANLSVLSFRLKFIPSGIKKQQSDKKVSALTKTTSVANLQLTFLKKKKIFHSGAECNCIVTGSAIIVTQTNRCTDE